MTMPRPPRAHLPAVARAKYAAVVAVVLLHTSAAVVTGTPVGSAAWWWGNGYDALTRWCVPVFVMISGLLLLAPSASPSNGPAPALGTSALHFYRRKWPRIVVPLLAWSALYVGWNAYKAVAWQGAPHLTQAAWAAVAAPPHYHLWYLYMVVGLYLVIPPLQALARQWPRPRLWGLTALLFALAALYHFGRIVLGQLPLPPFILWFVPYVPYVLAGYLIGTCQHPPRRAAMAATVLLCVVMTAGGCYLMSQRLPLDAGLYLYDYLSVTVIPMSLAAMAWLMAAPRPPSSAAAPQRDNLAFGIYLVHPVFLETFRHWGWLPELAWTPLSVPLQCAAVLAASWLVAWAISRSPLRSISA